VRAYESLASSGKPGEIYNVCVGQAVSIRHCLELLLGLTSKSVSTRVDPGRFQENDVPFQVGSPKRLRERTGWGPEIPLRQSLSDMLDDWRGRVKLDAE
jgi:GDP-4-dehydro-6-deoxy-D-mannose reductase